MGASPSRTPAVALLLAALGIYGVVAYSVVLRRREIGVRMAVGADVGSVSSLFFREGIVPVILGVGLGLGLAFGPVQLLRSLLYEISPVDRSRLSRWGSSSGRRRWPPPTFPPAVRHVSIQWRLCGRNSGLAIHHALHRRSFRVFLFKSPPETGLASLGRVRMLHSIHYRTALLGVLACVCFPVLVPGLAAQQVACVPGEPHPDAPPELRQFHFLIGQFDVLGSRWTDEGWSQPGPPAYWEGEYILGGFAIADYYYRQPPELGGTERGVNVRMYDPESGIWTMSWATTRNPRSVLLLEAEERDGLMWMYQMDDPETRFSGRKVSFHVVDEDTWYRVDEFTDDEGVTWIKTLRLSATRRSCSD